jgi:hypothetical protein
MTTNSARGFSHAHKLSWTPAVVIGLLVLGALGYIALVPDYVAVPEMSEAAWFELNDKAAAHSATANAENGAGPSNAQTEGVSTASASGTHSSRRDFD